MMIDATKTIEQMETIFHSDEVRLRSHADSHVGNAMGAIYDQVIAPMVNALEKIGLASAFGPDDKVAEDMQAYALEALEAIGVWPPKQEEE